MNKVAPTLRRDMNAVCWEARSSLRLSVARRALLAGERAANGRERPTTDQRLPHTPYWDFFISGLGIAHPPRRPQMEKGVGLMWNAGNQEMTAGFLRKDAEKVNQEVMASDCTRRRPAFVLDLEMARR